VKAVAPWAGWIGGFAGWAAAHQAGSAISQYDCAHANPVWMLPIGALAAAIILAGGLLSWSSWREQAVAHNPPAAVRRFVAGTGALASGIFLLAILFQTPSSFLIPSCYA
jgi:hypothetical protein